MYNPVSRSYGEPHKRPEVQNATIEFIAPSEYMVGFSRLIDMIELELKDIRAFVKLLLHKNIGKDFKLSFCALLLHVWFVFLIE